MRAMIIVGTMTLLIALAAVVSGYASTENHGSVNATDGDPARVGPIR